jgi:type I restriction enzyme S subunit
MNSLNIDKSKWNLMTLGDIADEISVRVDKPVESGYERFVGLEHFNSGSSKITSWGTTEKLTSSTKAFIAGDILFARRNAYLKRASLVEFDGVCSGDAFVLREKSDVIIPGFLAFIVNSSRLWDFANANAAGTMSKRVKWRDLKSFQISLPPLDAQPIILRLLWSANAVVHADAKLNEGLHSSLEVNRNSIFSYEEDAHSLNVNSDNQSNELNLSELYFEKSQNGIYKSKEFQGKGIRIINMGELFAYPIIEEQEMSLITLNEKEMANFAVKEGDLIFARRSLVIEGAGMCSIIGKHNSPMTFESSMIRVRLNFEQVNPKYIYHFLKSKEGRKRIRRIVGFTTVAGITSTDLAKVKVPVPSLQKQNEIVGFLDQFDDSFLSVARSSETSKELLNSIINKVF